MTHKKRKQESENDYPRIEISCPHCGGSSTWSLLQTLNQCDFCGSVLSWPYPKGEPDYLVAEAVIKNDNDVIEVLAMYDAMREASRRRGERRPPRSDYDPDLYFDLGAGFTDTAIYEIKRSRIHLFKVVKSICIYAPYQLISSLIAFHVLGRTSSHQKVFKCLFFSSEAILPGYSGEWNFRDRGLHMSKHTLKPLASGEWGESFIATGPITREIDNLTRQWTKQRKIFESEIQPICFHGAAIDTHRWWVYRPYYFVHAQTPQGSEWFLLDGQFGTIAGTPTSDEVAKVVSGKWKKLDLHSVRAIDIRVIPFRCPNCGWDVKLSKGIYQICDNCTRVLEVHGEGLKIVPYATVPAEELPWWPKHHRGPKVWLPFWRLEASMLFEKKTYEDVAQVMAQLVPAVKQAGPRKSLYIPAFDCWPVAKYDSWAFEFGSCLSETDISYREITIHGMKSSRDSVLSPAVSGGLLPRLFPHMAAIFTAPAMQSRLNTALINRLAEMHVLIKDRQLVFVPAAILEPRGLEPKVQGPKQPIDWLPLKNRSWPPMLQRTVRRWKTMEASEKKYKTSTSRRNWSVLR